MRQLLCFIFFSVSLIQLTADNVSDFEKELKNENNVVLNKFLESKFFQNELKQFEEKYDEAKQRSMRDLLGELSHKLQMINAENQRVVLILRYLYDSYQINNALTFSPLLDKQINEEINNFYKTFLFHPSIKGNEMILKNKLIGIAKNNNTFYLKYMLTADNYESIAKFVQSSNKDLSYIDLTHEVLAFSKPFYKRYFYNSDPVLKDLGVSYDEFESILGNYKEQVSVKGNFINELNKVLGKDDFMHLDFENLSEIVDRKTVLLKAICLPYVLEKFNILDFKNTDHFLIEFFDKETCSGTLLEVNFVKTELGVDLKILSGFADVYDYFGWVVFSNLNIFYSKSHKMKVFNNSFGYETEYKLDSNSSHQFNQLSDYLDFINDLNELKINKIEKNDGVYYCCKDLFGEGVIYKNLNGVIVVFDTSGNKFATIVKKEPTVNILEKNLFKDYVDLTIKHSKRVAKDGDIEIVRTLIKQFEVLDTKELIHLYQLINLNLFIGDYENVINLMLKCKEKMVADNLLYSAESLLRYINKMTKIYKLKISDNRLENMYLDIVKEIIKIRPKFINELTPNLNDDKENLNLMNIIREIE